MKKYVYSFISFHDSDLTSKVIESDLDPIAIVIKELDILGWQMGDAKFDSIDQLKTFAFDCDSMFNIIEI